MGVEAAEQHDVGLGLVGEHAPHLGVDLGEEVGGALGLGVERLGRERRDPGVLRVGVGEARVEAGTAQHHEHAVLALVTEEHLDAGHRHPGLELVDDDARLGVGDATGAAVGERAVGAEGGEVAAGGDVADAQLEVETGGGERAAPELELLGVVAEQAEVPGTRAGRDARTDRLEHPRGALAHELVEVRGGRFLELGAVVGVGVAAQAVHHDEEDLGVGGLDQRREVHAATLLCVARRDWPPARSGAAGR